MSSVRYSRPRIHSGYVVVELMFATAFVKTVVTALAALFIAATDVRAINAVTRTYSTRSCPVSSLHNLASIIPIFVACGHQYTRSALFLVTRVPDAYDKNNTCICPGS